MNKVALLNLVKMVLVFTTICLLSFAEQVQALSGVESIIHRGSKTELNTSLQVSCNENSSFCTDLCGYAHQCVVPETNCIDCVSNTYRLLHTLFTQLNSTFVISNEARSETEAIEFLRHQRFMSLSFDSYLNVFNPEKKEAVKLAFKSLCNPANVPILIQNPETYNPDKAPVLLIELDQTGRPVEPKFVMCQGGHSRRVNIHSLHYNPQFTPQQATTILRP